MILHCETCPIREFCHLSDKPQIQPLIAEKERDCPLMNLRLTKKFKKSFDMEIITRKEEIYQWAKTKLDLNSGEVKIHETVKNYIMSKYGVERKIADTYAKDVILRLLKEEL